MPDQSEASIQYIWPIRGQYYLAGAEDREAHWLAPVGHRLRAPHAVVQLDLHTREVHAQAGSGHAL